MKLSTKGRGCCSDTDPLTFVDTGHMSRRHPATNTKHERCLFLCSIFLINMDEFYLLLLFDIKSTMKGPSTFPCWIEFDKNRQLIALALPVKDNWLVNDLLTTDIVF